MDKIDKTKDNIGVNELDDGTRKKLFDKFVNAGGEILTERQKRRTLIIDRDGQRRMQSRLDSHRQKTASGNNRRKPKNMVSVKSQSSKKKEPFSLREQINTFKLRFRLKLLRITKYSGLYFNIKFLEKFNNQYKPALMEVQVIYLSLFKKDLKTGNKITSRLDNIKPLYYELIEALGGLYDKMIIDQIVDHYKNFPDVPKKVSELKEPMLQLFKKIYMIKIYENLSHEAMGLAIDFFINARDKGEGIDSSTKRKIRNDLFIIFHKLYPRLHWLFCHYFGVYYPYDDEAIEDYLSIDESERFGNRIFNRPDEETGPYIYETEPDTADIFQPDESETLIQEKKEKAPPPSVQQGLELMYRLDLKKLREKYDTEGLYARVSDSDKVLITYLLFSEFDREYSFILTTNKIKFNTDYIRRGEYNYKTKLNDLYDEMRKSHEALKNYAHELGHYEKARKERPVGNTQYIEYTKKLETFNKKKNIAGKIARMTVKAYMEKVTDQMKELIDDMTQAQKFISNPQDILEFNSAIEGERKINGLKIYEAINAAYNYSMAFLFRLSNGGELSGSSEMVDESGHREDEAATDEKDESGGGENKSILQELDDML